ncbi:MAG TPA: hypothetical protein VHL59_18380 [Thermoanaerobaculia bacterium]|nr:hypothetical protein [Thermoanaerobaculia bacterium]
MRRVSRGLVVLSLLVAVSAPMFARPSFDEPRDPKTRIIKVLKRIVKAFGDGLIIPWP